MDLVLAFNQANLSLEASWIIIIYGAVLFAMIIDFITGVRKAKLKGEATTSRGFRKTAEKASLYFLPMMCLTAIDVITSAFLDYPYMTALMGAFNIYIEIRSVWENTHSVEQTKKLQRCAVELIDFIENHRDELRRILDK